jgi:outer membrane protein assembly factor BamD
MDTRIELIALIGGLVYILVMSFFSRLLVLGLFGGVLIASAAGLIGCAGTEVEQTEPSVLLKEAEEDIASDHYQVAIEKLRTIKNKFPYSKFALDAQLRIADVLFIQENFGEAALTYESFKDLHPKHEKVAYASLRIAQSYHNDKPSTVARDYTPAQKALDAYQEFLRRFPNAPETDEARKAVANLREDLALKEMYIGDFYLRHNEFEAARGRYEKVIALYPETPPAKDAKTKLDQIKKTPQKIDQTATTGEKGGS